MMMTLTTMIEDDESKETVGRRDELNNTRVEENR